MQKKTISELEKEYDLEFDRIVMAVKREKAKIVLLQFPDGLKPYATLVVDELEKKIPQVDFLIWLGSCFGACDIPEVKDVDLIIQFGHSAWDYDEKSRIEVLK